MNLLGEKGDGLSNAFRSLLGGSSGDSGGLGSFGGQSTLNALSYGLGSMQTPQAVWQWAYVRRRFGRFLDNLLMTPKQTGDGNTKHAGIRSCLNRYYYGNTSETANSILIGSWGKLTQVRPPRDIDILFLLPPEVYWRIDSRAGNKQSQLLQEVRAVLSQTYSQTSMRGDGQVVVVPFESIGIEVVPGFRCTDGSIIICDTNDGGRYKISTAEAEARDLAVVDSTGNGNVRALTRITKQWQRQRNVPLKSFQLERLAVEFVNCWPYRLHDLFWYDWMVRDFFGYLIHRANGYLSMPGTGEIIGLGANWLSRAQDAYGHALDACYYEYNNYEVLAGREWQQIYGSEIPLTVS